MSVTVGIDLAAAPADTAVAGVRWSAGRAVVESVVVGADDDVVVDWMQHPDRAVGIDCPFGWPVKFVELVAQHASNRLVLPPDLPRGWRREYVLRATDIAVHARLGLSPLSVAADRIAHVAIRLAALRSRLDPEIGGPLDGSGALAEVYPAAALKVWQLPHRGYKRDVNEAARNLLVDQLQTGAPWLDLAGHELLVRRSDHALDALLCALVARARQRAWTEPPDDPALAALEGWIHVPTCTLAELC